MSPDLFVDRARDRGFSLYTGVPCSYLEPLINHVLASKDLRYVGACNEGDAVALAAGAHLGGQRAMVLMQNSGLGNAVNPLTSLQQVFGLPLLMVITLRGAPGGPPDEPQHRVMGPLTCRLLEAMDVPWDWFPTAEEEVGPALDRAVKAYEAGRPHVLLMTKGALAPVKLARASEARPLGEPPGPAGGPPGLARDEVLACIRGHARDTDVMVATTGYTGRALYALGDHPSQFYMVGSMGCASSLGLGLALACPERRVIVLDGDGAVLMRMGALAMVGYERPPNLLHVLLDNRCYESTGGQATVSPSVDLAQVAWACGYPRVVRPPDLGGIEAVLRGGDDALTFVHVKTVPGDVSRLPRPGVTPPEVSRRLAEWLREPR